MHDAQSYVERLDREHWLTLIRASQKKKKKVKRQCCVVKYQMTLNKQSVRLGRHRDGCDPQPWPSHRVRCWLSKVAGDLQEIQFIGFLFQCLLISEATGSHGGNATSVQCSLRLFNCFLGVSRLKWRKHQQAVRHHHADHKHKLHWWPTVVPF